MKRKLIYTLTILSVFVISTISNVIVAANGINITGPSIVIEGQDIVFTVKYDNNVSYIKISDADIALSGFTASSKIISGSGQTRTIKLTNLHRANSEYGYITINSGTGYLNSTIKLSSCTSSSFKIKTQQQIVDETTRPKQNNNNNNNNSNVTKPEENNNNTTKPNENNTVEEEKTQNEEQNNDEKENEDKNENEEQNNNNDYDEIVPNPNTGKEF